MKFSLCLLPVLLFGCAHADTLPTPTYKQLPMWHGFNLREKLYATKVQASASADDNGARKKFSEEDFQIIHELGFNFVRIPMDYRCWIVDGDWEKFDEEILKDIDEAIEFGKKYDIHVCLNLHRAPGFTVAKPAEPRDLWTDPEAQRVCKLHWQMFARRYKDVDPKYLSFNLFNEPVGVSEENYVKVVKMLVEAIHAENPNRVIIADGLYWGYIPVKSLYGVPVAQATRGYQPMPITHCKAPWTEFGRYPAPAWPFPDANVWFAGENFAGGNPQQVMTPLQINLALDKPAKFRIKIGRVSQHITLHAILDGKEVWQKEFTTGPGKGEWEKENYIPSAGIYQNYYNKNYEIDLPANAKQLVIKASKGDFCNVLELGITPQGEAEKRLIVQSEYRAKNTPLKFNQNMWDVKYNGREWHWQKYIEPWLDVKRHAGVFVGEFGCYNQTPHEITLAWMEDCLRNWQEAGFGWALWQLRGAFGILDSDRKDVEYEDFHGHKLDRKMLDLLLKYK